MSKWNTIIGVVSWVFMTVGVIIIGFFFGCKPISADSKKKPTLYELAAAQIDKADNNWYKSDIRRYIRIVCLENHAYYFASIFHNARGSFEVVFAPKLTDEGKPVKCGLDVEKQEGNQ